MTGRIDQLNALAFAAEGMAGTAGSAALRQVRSLADRAPAGRLFATIATLTEMSKRAEAQLESGRLAAAIGTMDAIATESAPAGLDEAPLYLRKSR